MKHLLSPHGLLLKTLPTPDRDELKTPEHSVLNQVQILTKIPAYTSFLEDLTITVQKHFNWVVLVRSYTISHLETFVASCCGLLVAAPHVMDEEHYIVNGQATFSSEKFLGTCVGHGWSNDGQGL